MKYLKIVLAVTLRIWFYIIAIFCTIFIGTTIYLLTYQKNDRITYFFMKLWAFILFYGTGFSYTLSSKKELKKYENYILIANHTSMMDIALMYILHPHHPIVFVGKKELESYPLFGRIYRKVSILVDRNDRRSRVSVVPKVKEKLNEGKNIVIFPEGGVPDRNIILGDFKEGAFAIARQCEVPIVIYSFHNLKNMFPFVNTLGYPGNVKVERLDIINPEGKTKEFLKNETFTMIYETIKNDPIEYPHLK